MNINEPIAETLTSGVLGLLHAVGIDLPGLGDPVAQRRQAASLRGCAASLRQGCVSVALSQQNQKWSGAAHDVQQQKAGNSYARLIASAELMDQAAEKLDKHAEFWEKFIKELFQLLLELYEMIRIGMLFSWATGLVGTAIFEARLGVTLQRVFEVIRAGKLAVEEFGKSIQAMRVATAGIVNPIRLAGWYIERSPSMARYVAEGMIGGDIAKLLSGQDPWNRQTQWGMFEGNVLGIMMGFKMGDLEERAAARFVPLAKFKSKITGKEIEDILDPKYLYKLEPKDLTTRAATGEAKAASETNLASHTTQQPAQAASRTGPPHAGSGDPAAGGTTAVPPTTTAGANTARSTGGGSTRVAGAGKPAAAHPDPAVTSGGKPAVAHPDPAVTSGGKPTAAHPDPAASGGRPTGAHPAGDPGAAGGGRPAGAAGHPDPGAPPAGSGTTTTAGGASVAHPAGGNTGGAAASHSGSGAAASHSAGGTGGTAEERLERARYLRDQLEEHQRNYSEAIHNYKKELEELGDVIPERTEGLLKVKAGSGDLTLSEAEQKLTSAQHDLDARRALTKQAEADAKAASQQEAAAKQEALKAAQAEQRKAEEEVRKAQDIRDAAQRHEEVVAKHKTVTEWKNKADDELNHVRDLRKEVNKAFPEASEQAERELAHARQELTHATREREAAESRAQNQRAAHRVADRQLKDAEATASQAERTFQDTAARRQQAAGDSADASAVASQKAVDASVKARHADDLAAEAERRRQTLREARERLSQAEQNGGNARALRGEVQRAEQDVAAAESQADKARREAEAARAEHLRAEDAAHSARARAQRLSEDENHAQAQAQAAQRKVEEAAGKAKVTETQAKQADEALARAREQERRMEDEVRQRTDLSREAHQEAKSRFTHSRSVSSMWHSTADVEKKLFAVQSRRETVYNELIRSTFNSAMINLTFDLSANAIHKLGLPSWLMMGMPEKGWKEIALDSVVGGITFGSREYLRHQVISGDTSAVGNAERLPGGPLHNPDPAHIGSDGKPVDPKSLAHRDPEAAKARSGRWNPPASAAIFAPPKPRVLFRSFGDFMYTRKTIPLKIPGLGGHSVPLPRLGMFPAAHRNSAQDAPAAVRSGAEMFLGAINNGGEGLVNGFIKNNIKELLNITPPAASTPQPAPAQPSPSPSHPSPSPTSPSPAPPSHSPSPSPSPSGPPDSTSPSPAPPSPTPSAPTVGGGHVTVGPSAPTLWDIAVDVYGDGSKWVDIWHANPDISDPSQLKNGMKLELPELPSPSARAHR
ncbi:hypothetical protein NE235_03405 [Actinoallomurus spadix]|uniref:LysM domain-containing protein n=1 Tax=Actinoallomurus spadix TaxID=79912 RepID=A0ABN0XLU7_9ACTN|nr:hypothetical protein [Actinoallomurus spadix]MCO5985152.1 hypothetical protein [Actinoallomurus spadix]